MLGFLFLSQKPNPMKKKKLLVKYLALSNVKKANFLKDRLPQFPLRVKPPLQTTFMLSSFKNYPFVIL